MFRHTAGETVKGGFYWSQKGWRLETVQGPSGVLPGEPGTKYARVPVLVMIPLALAMGGGFVLFLPLIGFGVMAEWLFVKARAAVRQRLESTRRTAAPVPTSRRG
jgi:hypothetical protein